MKKAKVFISSGQRSAEKEIGINVAQYLRKKGFDPYFAEEVQTPEALTNNIFDSLRNTEYFISINFEREKSEIGSLFIQQEFAIAAYLEIPMLAFHKGDIPPAGIGKYLILKSISIANYNDVVRHLKKVISDGTWNPLSVHQLELTCGHHHSNFQTLNIPNSPLSNWLHVVVHNKSHIFYCKNCYAYVESINDVTNNKELIGTNDYKTELIWAGTNDITVNIPQGGKKDIDILTWYHGGLVVQFHQRTSSSAYGYQPLSYGKYKIIYGVISDNFPIAKIEIEIEFTDTGIAILSSHQIK